MANEKNQNSSAGMKVELGNKVVGKIELPQIDVSKYIGKKAKIELVEEFEGEFGYYIKVSTGVIDVLKDVQDKDGKPLELRATRIFGLHEDKDGRIGWGENTKLGLYLTKMNVKHYNDLKQREVVVQTVTNSKDGRDYLTFN